MSTMSSSVKQIVFLGYYIIAIINYFAVHASHDKNQCTYETQEDRIINIHESKALGARLLGAWQMPSAANCTAACCGQFYGKCNMAFYHEVSANEKNCFLAMCEPIDMCVLTTIEGFSATAVTKIEIKESHNDKSFLTTFLNKLEDEFMKEGALSKPVSDPDLKFHPLKAKSLNPILLHRQKRHHVPGHVESSHASTLTSSTLTSTSLTRTPTISKTLASSSKKSSTHTATTNSKASKSSTSKKPSSTQPITPPITTSSKTLLAALKTIENTLSSTSKTTKLTSSTSSSTTASSSTESATISKITPSSKATTTSSHARPTIAQQATDEHKPSEKAIGQSKNPQSATLTTHTKIASAQAPSTAKVTVSHTGGSSAPHSPQHSPQAHEGTDESPQSSPKHVSQHVGVVMTPSQSKQNTKPKLNPSPTISSVLHPTMSNSSTKGDHSSTKHPTNSPGSHSVNGSPPISVTSSKDLSKAGLATHHNSLNSSHNITPHTKHPTSSHTSHQFSPSGSHSKLTQPTHSTPHSTATISNHSSLSNITHDASHNGTMATIPVETESESASDEEHIEPQGLEDSKKVEHVTAPLKMLSSKVVATNIDLEATTSRISLLQDNTTESNITESPPRPTNITTTANNSQITGKISKCEKELLSATAKGLIGSYTPQCTEGGDYELIQCHGSTGYCWCVDENGEEIQGTKAGRGEGRPNCADYCPATNDMIGTCEEECSSNRDCTQGHKCCSNGCGHTCMDLSQKDVQAKQHPTNKEALTSKPDTKTTQKPTERRTSRITTTSAPATTTAPPRTIQKTRTTQRTSTQRATTQKAKTTARQKIVTTTKSKVTAKLEKKVTEKPSEVLTTQKPLEPQDSRKIELPGTSRPVQQQLPVTNNTLPQKLASTNETAAAVETLDQDKPKSVTISYLSSNGALVAAMCFGVLFLLAVCVLVGKRWYEGYQRRHYNKMDYLINGMYN